MHDEQSDFRPAISLVASPTKRHALIDLAKEAERRGFTGIACPSLGAAMALCTSLAHETTTLRFWSSIQPIYYSHPVETANTAAHIHEISNGRFSLGLGVSHGPVVKRLGVATGKPLGDVKEYVSAMRANERFSGSLPPLLLATLRDKMLTLALEIADGAVWANASLRDIDRQVASVRATGRTDFFLANMIPTVIADDPEEARMVNRKTMLGYVSLPNYRNYWRDAGFGDQMDAIEAAQQSGEKAHVLAAMSEDWLDDCTISGNARIVRERLLQWQHRGVLPIAVMSSTSGGQAKAIGELFDAYA